MRPSWIIYVTLHQNTRALTRVEEERHGEEEDRGQEAAVLRPQASECPEPQQAAGGGACPGACAEKHPAGTFMRKLWPPGSHEGKFSVFQATRLVVIWFGSPGRQTRLTLPSGPPCSELSNLMSTPVCALFDVFLLFLLTLLSSPLDLL